MKATFLSLLFTNTFGEIRSLKATLLSTFARRHSCYKTENRTSCNWAPQYFVLSGKCSLLLPCLTCKDHIFPPVSQQACSDWQLDNAYLAYLAKPRVKTPDFREVRYRLQVVSLVSHSSHSFFEHRGQFRLPSSVFVAWLQGKSQIKIQALTSSVSLCPCCL